MLFNGIPVSAKNIQASALMVIVLAIFVCGFVFTPALATTSRLISLGGIGDYIEDDHNTLRWSGSLCDYPNLVSVNSGPFTIDGYPSVLDTKVSSTSSALHFSPGLENRYGTAAVYLHGNYGIGNSGSLSEDVLFFGGATLMYGRSVGPVQATVHYFNKTGTLVDRSIYRASETVRRKIGLGLRFDISDDVYLDFSGEKSKHGLNQNWQYPSAPIVSRSETSWSNYSLRVRSFVNLGHQLALVPLMEYLYQDSPSLVETPGFWSNLQGHNIRYGCGLNFTPDSDHLLFVSVDHVSSRNKDRLAESEELQYSYVYDINWDCFEATLGLESRFHPWLTLRGSLGYKCINSEEYRSAESAAAPTTPVSNYSDAINLSLGLGVHLYSFDLDLAVSSQAPARSPHEAGSFSAFSEIDQQWMSITLRYGFNIF